MLGRQPGFYRFLQELPRNIRAFLLRQLALATAIGTSVNSLGCLIDAVFGIFRRKQAVIDGQECVAIRPADSQHAKSVDILLMRMVENPGQQFDRLGTVAAEQRIVDDEYIPALFAGKRRNGLANDLLSQQRGETTPVDAAGVHEPVDHILAKGKLLWMQVHLHIQRTLPEYSANDQQEHLHGRDTLELVCIRSPQ